MGELRKCPIFNAHKHFAHQLLYNIYMYKLNSGRIPFCVDNPNNSKNNISSIQPSPSFSTKKPRSLVSDAVVKPPPELPNYLIDLTRQIHDLFKVGENSTGPSHINELASTVLRRPVSVKKQSLVLAEAITRSVRQ